MQEVTPSEILGELRNDGRSRHHRVELEVKIARAQAKLDELKVLAGLVPGEDQLGGS